MSELETTNLMLQNFDPEAFLGVDYEEATETKRTLIPQGWTNGRIEDFEVVKPKQFADKKNGGQMTWSSPVLKLKIIIENEGIREMLQVPKERPLYFYPMLYLDLTPEGVLDMGPNRNILLGQLREATGQNRPGERWNITHLRGSPELAIEIAHVADKEDPEKVFERVKHFAAITA